MQTYINSPIWHAAFQKAWTHPWKSGNFLFLCLSLGIQSNYRAWFCFYFLWPSPVFVNWILSHHPSLEDTSHVTSGYIHQIWAVFCVPGQFRFAGFLLVPALRVAAGAPGCSHACDVFCRSVSAAVLREARAVVGATITGRAWRRGTVLKTFLVLSLDIFLL